MKPKSWDINKNLRKKIGEWRHLFQYRLSFLSFIPCFSKIPKKRQVLKLLSSYNRQAKVRMQNDGTYLKFICTTFVFIYRCASHSSNSYFKVHIVNQPIFHNISNNYKKNILIISFPKILSLSGDLEHLSPVSTRSWKAKKKSSVSYHRIYHAT